MATATPVENNPFATPPVAKPIPVDHDPFAVPSVSAKPAVPVGATGLTTTDIPSKPSAGAFDIIDAAAQADRADAATGYGRKVGDINPYTGAPVERPFEVGRTALAGVQGANEMAAQMLMLPLLLGTAAAQGGAKVLGLPPPRDIPAELMTELRARNPIQPENEAERAAARGGSQAMMIAPLSFGAAPFGAAYSAARAATPLATAEESFPIAKQVVANISQSAAAKPLVFPAIDVAANIGSGVGAQVGQEQGGRWGEAFGSAAGGFLPTFYPKWISPVGIAARLAAKFTPGAVDAAVGALPGSAGRAETAYNFANRLGPFADPSVPNPNDAGWVSRALAASAARNSARLQGRISNQLGSFLKDPGSVPNLEEAQALRETIPGFNPSVAKSMGSQGLLNQERALGQAATGEDLTALRAQTEANAAAINQFAGGRVPPTTGATPADQQVIDLLTAHAQAADRAAAQGTATVENQIRDATAALPERPAIQTGEQLRGARDVAERTMNEEVARRRAAIDPDSTFREPTTNLYTSIVSRLNNLGTDLTNAVIPPKVREILGNTRPQTILDAQGQPAGRWAPTYDIDSLLTAREQVGQRLRTLQAGGQPASMSGADALHAVREGIDAEIARISQAPPPSGAPQITQQPRALETTVGGRPEAVASGVPAPAEQPSTVQSRLADFNRFYREEYVPRFRQDLGAELGRTRASGQEVIKPEDIAPRLLAPNAVSEMRQFNLIHGEDPAVRQTVIDAALDDIRRTGVRDGALQPTAVQDWLRSHSRVLDEAPWLREAVAGRDPSQLYQRLGQAEQARAATADEQLTTLLGGKRDAVLGTAMNDPRTMQQLAANARSAGPDAEAALRRAVWERALKEGGGEGANLPDPFKIRDLITNKGEALRHVLGPEHMGDLETIARASEIEGRLPVPKGATEEPTTASTIVKSLTGHGIPSVQNKLFAFESGRVPKAYLATDMIMRFFNQFSEKEAQRAWREALSNPNVAKTIADGIRNGKASPMQSEKLNSYLLQAPMNTIEDVRRRQEEEQ